MELLVGILHLVWVLRGIIVTKNDTEHRDTHTATAIPIPLTPQGRTLGRLNTKGDIEISSRNTHVARMLGFDPVGMAAVLVFVVEGRQGIFPLLEFVDYVSFYLHNYTNNFQFVSFLTFFRTCRVQIYDIKRKGTSFRRVILAHWR